MTNLSVQSPDRFRAYGLRQLGDIEGRYGLTPEQRDTVDMVGRILPFRVNQHVLDNLVDWSNIPSDPVFQMTFPQAGMISDSSTGRLRNLQRRGWPSEETRKAVREIHASMNPHPSGQMELNVPRTDAGESVPGLQHKYRETVLYFPSQGQTCHAYCSYCFRWAQFVGDSDLRFAAPEPTQLVAHLRAHPDVSDVLITGGDPMMMSTSRIVEHIDPIMDVPTVRTIRFGTKSLSYWPHRFVGDHDADHLLRTLERIVASGRDCAIMAHFSHPREVEDPTAAQAIKRIRATGARIFCQSPLIAKVNDDAAVWASLWKAEFAAGATPYYMFVERDTGPYDYFKVPLVRAVEVFQDAYRVLPGLARTVRGPVMSATPGKIVVDGVGETRGVSRLFLRFMQARNAEVVGVPFTAAADPHTSWATELRQVDATPELLKELTGYGQRPDLVRRAAG